MIQVINNSRNPAFNLALEEYFLKRKDLAEDVLILWQNAPTIVIGKNQNAWREVNFDYIKTHGIALVRRLSGGGAVFHDSGNLNFTIIKANASLSQNDFAFFTQPVVQCLCEMGVPAQFNGRNDIEIEGKKFSGNAQYIWHDRLLHHGTLLFNSDLTMLTNALNPSAAKIEAKGIQSIKSRVTNIVDYLGDDISLEDFKDRLVASFRDNALMQLYELRTEDYREIDKLMTERYGTKTWNYGENVTRQIEREKRFVAGTVAVWLDIKNDIINDIKIYGDFFEAAPVTELEKLLQGICLTEVRALFASIEVVEYIKRLTNAELLSLLV